ncbi:MAG: peroxiredoxin family protein [Spirochaetia bacterium]|nr:peroxiredoxin family protein [Spirochaetia bacterium]
MKRNSKLKIITSIIILLLSNNIWSIKKNDEAPSILLKMYDGKTFNLRSHMKSMKSNDFTAFAFFSVTCKPCKKELPELQKLFDEYSDKGFKVFAISLDNPADNSPEQVKEFLESINVSFPLMLDTYKKAGKAYGIVKPNGEAVLPGLFVIDSNRKIVIEHIGYSEKTIQEIKDLVSKN